MGLFRKKGEVPDVGQEEEFDKKSKRKKKEEEIDFGGNANSKHLEVKAKKSKGNYSDVELTRVGAKLEALDSFTKALNERLSTLSQQIGELRAMNLNTEKSIIKATQEAEKTIDVVKAIKPEELRVDYQRIDMKVTQLSEKLESNKQFSDTLMNEVKDIRRKAGIFVGTDALLKLNDEVKKDLIEIQKIGSRVRANSEKSEQIFIGIKNEFAQTQKLNDKLLNLDDAYSTLTEQMEKLRVDLSKIITDDDFYKYKQGMDKRILGVEKALYSVGSMKQENERLARLIESTLSISKRNKQNIGELAVAVGDNNLEKVQDYEERFSTILKLINQLAAEMKTNKPTSGKTRTKKQPKSRVKKNKKTGKKLKKVVRKVSKDNVKIENVQNQLKSIFKKPKN